VGADQFNVGCPACRCSSRPSHTPRTRSLALQSSRRLCTESNM